MTTTTETLPPVGTREWLLIAAERLDTEGQHELAAEARAEAATAGTPRPAPQPAVVRCDGCGRPVTERQAAQYAALGVDWALCSRLACHGR